jgi:hypothetical protein
MAGYLPLVRRSQYTACHQTSTAQDPAYGKEVCFFRQVKKGAENTKEKNPGNALRMYRYVGEV